MGKFSRFDGAVLRRAGETWSALTGDEEVITFDAIFDMRDEVRDDGSGLGRVVRITQLTCLTSVADAFNTTTMVTSPAGVSYRVTDVLIQDDGALSWVYVVKVSTENCS